MLVVGGLCCWRSLLELHHGSKFMSQNKTRCYLQQMALGCTQTGLFTGTSSWAESS